MDKKILGLIVIIVLIGIGAGYMVIQTPESNDSEINNMENNETVDNDTAETRISAEEAVEIVQTQVIAEPDHTAANPSLNQWEDGRMVWNVQIIDGEGNVVSGVDIDANTGEVLGKG